MRRSKWLAAALVATGLALVAVPSGASAQDENPWSVFTNCPINDPEMRDPANVSAICVAATTNGGSLQIGDRPVVNTDGKPVNVQFGLRVLEDGTLDTVSQPDAVRATPVAVPGGLVGLVGEQTLKRLVGPFVTDAVNRVNATVTQAGPIADFDLVGALTGTPIFTLPVKIKLSNPVLGNQCYIGSNANPIVLHPQSGTTSPPPPNEPITGDPGELTFVNEPSLPPEVGAGVIGTINATLVDNSFAVPKASGCGPLGLLDGAINSREHLPQPGGTSTVILEDNDSFLGGAVAFDGLTGADYLDDFVTDNR